MPSRDKGQVEIVVIERAAGVAGIDFLHPMTGEISRKLMHGKKLGARFLTDAHRIPGVILVPMSERHMSRSFDRLMQGNSGLLEGGIAGQKGIDQDAA